MVAGSSPAGRAMFDSLALMMKGHHGAALHGHVVAELAREAHTMKEARWDESLSVGIAIVDEQHKALIARMNDVSRAVELAHGPLEVTRTLGFLIDYTNYHFADEEKYMQQANYPGLADQQAAHQKFRDTLASLEQDFEEEGSTQSLAEAVNTMLFNWFVKHIEGLDREFGAYLKREGIKISETD